jgi:hypothetical protein
MSNLYHWPHLFSMRSVFALFYCNLWLFWLCRIVPHYLINSTNLGGGGVIEHKMFVLILSTNSSEIFTILRRIQRDIIINVRRSSHKNLVILVRFLNETWIFSTDFRKTLKNQISWKYVLWGAQLFHADGREEANSRLSPNNMEGRRRAR